MSFDGDFGWQRQFIPEMKLICGYYLMGEASADEDTQRNTDLSWIVLKLEPMRIACRVRRHDQFARYGRQFTIRSRRSSGVPTELDKVISGWGDYIFYGFAAAEEQRIMSWTLGDLGEFRSWRLDCLRRSGEEPGEERANGDGTWFRAYRLSELPDEFVKQRKRHGTKIFGDQ